MSEPGRVPSHGEGGRWRRSLRLAGFTLQLGLCLGLAIWSASSGETLLLMIAVFLAATAAWLGLREIRGRAAPSRRTSR